MTGALPDIPEGTRLYLEPAAFATGAAAEALCGNGLASRLAGGPVAFTALQVIARTADGKGSSSFAAVPEVQRWAERLAQPARDRAALLLQRLGAARSPIPGLPASRPGLMGIVNVTPDSFSDGGEHLDAHAAIAFARSLAADGADILDIGGESTRPGARPVDPETERARVMPVLEALRDCPAALSIDTRRASVMRAALGAGVGVLNDVSALTADPDSLSVAARSDAAVVLMHAQGVPETMNDAPRYGDVALDVFDWLEARIDACVAAGIARERILVDPGVGFGKRRTHNRELLRRLALFHGLGFPILLGVSRKGLIDGDEQLAPKQRLPASLAAITLALTRGVQLFRVHDVKETKLALDLWRAQQKQESRRV